MIPQRAEILPRNISPTDQKPLRNSIFLHADQMGNPLLGIKDPSKMPAQVSGDMRDPWAYMTHLTATRYAYETLLSSPFSRSREGYGSFDFSILSSARRKNATRETTSSLKAWLHEHRKNPYPTKGEKIMLAILTKMTLTQISTWFANARRRLKKDNKMTWSPRNKTGEKKDCSSKSSKLDDDENLNSSNEDEEMAEYVEKNKESSAIDGKELENMEDIVIENDAFSDESSLNELSQDGETEIGLNSLDMRYEEAKAVWSQLSEKSPKELMKKYNSNISPVGDLQRWVDGHFGNQSPLDFPRELTPPRTPVEEIVFNGDLDSKEPVRKSSPSLQNVDAESPSKICLSSNKATVELHPEVTAPRLMPPRLTSPPMTSPRVTSVSEDLIRSVASNDNSLHRQFRTSGLTSHREIDAVLALTALSSR